MKKILTALALVATAGFAFGQGQVNFLNSSTTLVSTNRTTTGVLSGPVGSYYFGLFQAPSGAVDPNAFTFVGYGTNMAAAGYLNGGIGGAGAPSIAGMTAGTAVNVLFRGWSANLGKDWTAVDAAVKSIVNGTASVGPVDGFYYGQSAIGTVTLGGGTTPIPNPFGTGAGQIGTGFTLSFVPVPEPSTFALAGLAGAALLIFRRRK